MFRPLAIALQFLTILPVRIRQAPDPAAIGRSLIYYPLVGLGIGGLLALVAWLLNPAPPLLGGAVVLSIWVVVTGALHLDGLADSADAWVAGHGDRERTLVVMKDPRSGPMAVVALVLVLLLKFVALTQLVASNAWEVVLLTPVLGRAALVLLFLTTPYVREQGLGSSLATHLPRRACQLSVGLTLLVVTAWLGLAGLWLVAVFGGVFAALRRLMQRRLGGTTGDTAGALVEIAEAALLLTGALTL